MEQARLKAQAMKIESESELERLGQAREAEIKFVREQNEIEIGKSKEITAIEVRKFKDTVEAIGSDTIRAIAVSGPEMQVKLLQSLGLKVRGCWISRVSPVSLHACSPRSSRTATRPSICSTLRRAWCSSTRWRAASSSVAAPATCVFLRCESIAAKAECTSLRESIESAIMARSRAQFLL